MKYACENCRYYKQVPPSWAGKYCSRTVDVTDVKKGDKNYLVVDSNTKIEVYMIVYPDFLCNEWKPKE